MNELILKLTEHVSQGGVFAVFLFLILLALGFALYKLFNRLSEVFGNHIQTITESNAMFAKSSQDSTQFIQVMQQQSEATLHQLDFIKISLLKQNKVLIDLIEYELSKIPKEDLEFRLKLQNIIHKLEEVV